MCDLSGASFGLTAGHLTSERSHEAQSGHAGPGAEWLEVPPVVEGSQPATHLEQVQSWSPGEGLEGSAPLLAVHHERDGQPWGTQCGQCWASSASGWQTSERAALWAGRRLSLEVHSGTGLCRKSPLVRAGQGGSISCSVCIKSSTSWLCLRGAQHPAEAPSTQQRCSKCFWETRIL